MCYLYCKRFIPPGLATDPVLQSLRRELYLEEQQFDHIEWDQFRQTCASIDQYSPLNPVMKVAQDLLVLFEQLVSLSPMLKKLRKASLDFVIGYIHAEDEQTNYIDIGTISLYIQCNTTSFCVQVQ